MAEEPKSPIENEDAELDLDTPIDAAIPEGGDDEGEDEEEVLVFGDETESRENDSGLVKYLREELKKRDKMLTERSGSRSDPVDPGPEPTLEDCEFDEDLYKARLREWDKKVAAVDERKGNAEQAEDEERQSWEAELARVNEEKSALPYGDSDDAFDLVRTSLSAAQQAALVQATDSGNTAKLIYALGKNPAKLAAIADEKNLVKFIKEVTKLEGQLKMIKRRKAPEIDEPVRSSAKISPQTSDKKLAKLEAEAEKTGDRTKVIEYKRSLKQGAK